MNFRNTLLSIIILISCYFSATAGVVYVDSAHVTGVQSGTSWATAFQNLQTGINAANFGDSVWVAKGTYHTDSANLYSFNMKEGVKIFGGFINTDTAFQQRNWLTNATILHGHNNSVINNYNNNLTNASWIDGFEITNGFSYYGGGMFNYESSPTVNNCIFSNDTAFYAYAKGGAIYNYNCSTVIMNSTFKDNFVDDNITDASLGGGAIYNKDAFINIINCHFLSNKIEFFASGGAIYNDSSVVNILNSTFDSNMAKFYGGAIHSVHSSFVSVYNSTFSSNISSSGGAISSLSSSSTFVNNCNFSDNATVGGWGSSNTTSGGGAIYNWAAHLFVDSCTFSSNALQQGTSGVIHNINYLSCSIDHSNFMNNSVAGIHIIFNNTCQDTTYIKNSIFSANQDAQSCIYNSNLHLEINNCLFFKNGGTLYGQSAIRNDDATYAKIINCTIAQNSFSHTGSIENNSNSSATVQNSIIWGNSPSGFPNTTPSLTISHSLVEGITTDPANHNLSGDINPHFTDTASGLYSLTPLSLCINAGNNNFSPQTTISDLNGNTRIFDGQIDMGAYEFTAVLPPDANMGPDISICKGDDLILTAPYSAYTSYLWSNGDTTRSVYVDDMANTTYHVTVTNALGVATDTIQIIVDTLPFVDLGNDTSVLGDVITLDAGNINDPATYLWNTGATSQAITVSENGTYRVKVTNNKGCSAEDSVNVDFIISVDIDDKKLPYASLFAYPNPADDHITVVVPEHLLNTTMTINDILGNIMIKYYIDKKQNKIALLSLPPGLYILKPEYGSSIKFTKK